MIGSRYLSHVDFYGGARLHQGFEKAGDAIQRLSRRTSRNVLSTSEVIHELIRTPGIYFGPGIHMSDVLKAMQQIGLIELSGDKVIVKAKVSSKKTRSRRAKAYAVRRRMRRR